MLESHLRNSKESYELIQCHPGQVQTGNTRNFQYTQLTVFMVTPESISSHTADPRFIISSIPSGSRASASLVNILSRITAHPRMIHTTSRSHRFRHFPGDLTIWHGRCRSARGRPSRLLKLLCQMARSPGKWRDLLSCILSNLTVWKRSQFIY